MNETQVGRQFMVVIMYTPSGCTPEAVGKVCTFAEAMEVGDAVDGEDERALFEMIMDWSDGDSMVGDNCDPADERPLTQHGISFGFWMQELPNGPFAGTDSVVQSSASELLSSIASASDIPTLE